MGSFRSNFTAMGRFPSVEESCAGGAFFLSWNLPSRRSITDAGFKAARFSIDLRLPTRSLPLAETLSASPISKPFSQISEAPSGPCARNTSTAISLSVRGPGASLLSGGLGFPLIGDAEVSGGCA